MAEIPLLALGAGAGIAYLLYRRTAVVDMQAEEIERHGAPENRPARKAPPAFGKYVPIRTVVNDCTQNIWAPQIAGVPHPTADGGLRTDLASRYAQAPSGFSGIL